MSDLIKTCQRKAEELHAGVTYGDGLSMLDQVLGTKKLVEEFSRLQGQDKEVAMAAALLHKCFETKRINAGKALSTKEVESIAGPQVLSIITELQSEPENKSLSKKDQWAEKAEWAKTLSPAAQEIVLAEKIMNFETTRDRMNAVRMANVPAVRGATGVKNPMISDDPKSKPAWHKEYMETRMLVVDALQEVNPRMYVRARKAHGEAMIQILTIEQQQADINRKIAERRQNGY